MLLTAPCYNTGEQPNGQPWPEDSPRRLAEYNSLVRQVGSTEPDTTVVNFEAMACPAGRYQSHLDGVQVRYDGVHFTLGGGAVFEPQLFPIVAQLGRADGRRCRASSANRGSDPAGGRGRSSPQDMIQADCGD